MKKVTIRLATSHLDSDNEILTVEALGQKQTYCIKRMYTK